MGQLSESITRRGAAAESVPTARAAADVMRDELRRQTAQVLGDDLSLSRWRQAGAARLDATAAAGRAEVTASGAAFTIADKGRRTARPAVAPAGSALKTPFGPRASVRGSTSRGHDIVGRAQGPMFDAAARAVVTQVDRMM